jgi:hypothetical protein
MLRGIDTAGLTIGLGLFRRRLTPSGMLPARSRASVSTDALHKDIHIQSV